MRAGICVRKWVVFINKSLYAVLLFVTAIISMSFANAPGVVDLRHKNSEDFVADLGGEWRFYWNRPFSVDSLSEMKPDGYFSMPGYWTDFKLQNEKLPDFGYATFSRTVYIPSDCIGAPMMILTPDQITSYTVWVDGKEVSKGGRAGTTKKTTISKAAINIASFTPSSEKVEIVMRVSNFSVACGGPHRNVSIGTPRAVMTRFLIRYGIDLIFLGAILLAGFYHLGLYSLQREMHSYLFFGVFTLLWALRFFVEGMYTLPITFLFPDLSYELLIRFETIFAIPTSGLLLLFLYTLFPVKKMRGWLRFSFITSIGLILASFLLPPVQLNNVLKVFENFSLLLIYPSLVILVKAIRKRSDSAWLVLAGILCYFFSAINDVFYSLRIIDTAYTIIIGIVLLILFFSAVLSRRFEHAYSSEKRLAHELEEKNKSLSQLDTLKDEFIANTSHELRTPLQGIVGLAEGLSYAENTAVSPEVKKGLSLIAASGRRLANLINDIQDFSRIKNRDITLVTKPVDIHSCVSTVIALAYNLRQSDKVEFKNLLPEKFALVYGDEQRLEQIFYNIVGNAVKYTFCGTITVTGKIDGKNASVFIEDTGIGIREDKLETLFLPYEQAAEKEELQAGTGIGLSITKHLIELHGGSISVKSRYGEGSCFTIVLPLAPEGSVCIKSAPLLSSVLPDVTFSGMPEKSSMPIQRISGTVLVVDDDPVNRSVFTTILGSRFTSVFEACDGYEALELIDKHPIDVVLLDIMMPRMDGYETLKKIRKGYSPVELPVIVLTAKNRSIDLVTGFNAGANDYLTKPCGKEEIVARVDSQIQIGKITDLKEKNQALTRIIEIERQMQKESLLTLGRLESMLDFLSDPVALVDETHTVYYANRSFCSLIGQKPSAISGNSIDAFVSDKEFSKMLDRVFSGGCINGSVTAVQTSISSIICNLNLASITAGDESLVMISPGDDQNGRNLNSSYNVRKEGLKDRNECAKQAIADAVSCWCEETGLAPIELARQSGIWKIHTNSDGWERSKTLDRYLSSINFPKNPRIKTVIATIAFVLERIGSENPNYRHLRKIIDNLQNWV